MTENKNTAQEIDLLELFGNMWSWTKNIFKSIIYFFFRNAILFTIVLIISAAVGYISSKLSKPFYKSELYGYSHTISNVETIQYLNNWNYTKGLTDEEAKSLKEISANFLLDLNYDGEWDIVEESEALIVTDTTIINKRVPGGFCIRAEIYDTVLLDKLKDEAIKYLNENIRVQQMNEIRLDQTQALIKKIDQEIEDLDKKKRLDYFETPDLKNTKKGDLVLMDEKETSLYHEDLIELYQTKQELEKELFLASEPIELTQDFTVPRFQENSMVKIIIKYIKYGLIIGFFLILIVDRRKTLGKMIIEARASR